MSVNKPGNPMFGSVGGRMQKKLTHRGNRNVDVTINLTAMVDMFTVLVAFLLMLFNATGEIVTQDKDIKMPKAMNNKELQRALILQVSPAAVKLEGQVVVNTATLLDEKADDDVVTRPLANKLIDKRRAFARENKGKPAPEEVIIQADVDVEYMAMKRIMMACAKNGYHKINLAVEQRPQE